MTVRQSPLVAVSGAAIYVRARVERPLPIRRALSLGAGGALIALITTGALETFDALRGPTLWGPGSALAETLLAITVGLLIGLTASVRPRRPKADA
ncbi:hypothetical protein [Cryobacterium psychrophilum]|uniref:Uncharacterized protein n=1 Tax=Cryobacterium psychrophilum TaxID=41988 RepID=A0A4Y8KK01_9MICO|nr:hypothetical protein [Cryobacterium psychrophilum]TDW30804.1 hypothetical protein EDD25_2580 [Cryobacterium psychrophilum]TFD75799.1 hypothetical protein E3T53_15110 [Cryobacterium psychrophilum]